MRRRPSFPPRSRPIRIITLPIIALAATLAAESLHAQQSSGRIRANALTVFLDCQARNCDSEYFRTEIDFVNWVRDRTLAQVQVIVTSSDTGGGGQVYGLDFVGLQDLDGQDDSLPYTAAGTDTESETLDGLTNVIGAGLARYSTLIGRPAAFTVSGTDAPDDETLSLVSADQVQDPWNFWVFEVSADLDLEGEETEKSRRESGSFEARRTTDRWKMEFDVEGNFSQDERELGDGEIIRDDRTNWNAGLLMAHSLADNWSLGFLAGAGASTRRNQTFGSDVAAAVEYSFFPYADAPRRSLTASYDLGLQYFDWEEETIYFQTEELRPQHQLRLQLFQRQPWGESRVSINGSQFIDDLDLWRVSLSGDLEIRLIRGLQLEIEADVEFLEDQIFISREGLTDEEILLGRFERPTSYVYELSVGLSFEFGSIYNNVVNNRFDRGFGF